MNDVSGHSTDGSSVINTDQDILLWIENGDAVDHVVMFTTPLTQDDELDLAVKEHIVTIAAGVTKVFGPFPNSIFGTSGVLWIDWYDATGPTYDASSGEITGGTKSATSMTMAVLNMGTL